MLPMVGCGVRGGMELGTRCVVTLVLGVLGCVVHGVGAFGGRSSRAIGSPSAGGAGLWHCRSAGI